MSCARQSIDIEPIFSPPGTFSQSGSDPLPDRWWAVFEDHELNALMAQALEYNFSLRSAWDRLDQARAVAVKSGARLWPSIDGSTSVSRSVSKSTGSGRSYSTDYQLGITAGYEVDLWGRNRATRDAASLAASAAEEDLHAAAITLTAELAGTWYRMAEQQRQMSLLDEQSETNEKYLEIITLKFRRGQVSAADVLQQRQLVESTMGERILVESSLKVLEHQLAILLGLAPGALEMGAGQELPEIPPLPQAGLPAEWIRRRPDIISAELRIKAEDRRVAAAIADRFPELGLTIRAETSAEEIRDLFDNWLASLAANLIAPLVDGGQRRAEVERTRAVLSEQLNSYGQLVLESLKEVEDALYEETKQAEYVASLGAQLELSEKSTGQTLENYTKGTMEFTRYLTTLLAHQRLQRTYLRARLELVLLRIDLYRALAGSWPMSHHSRDQVSGVQKPEGHSDAIEPKRLGGRIHKVRS